MGARRSEDVVQWVAANVQALRLERGLTQEPLDEAAHLAPAYLHRLESGG